MLKLGLNSVNSFTSTRKTKQKEVVYVFLCDSLIPKVLVFHGLSLPFKASEIICTFF